MALTNEQIEQTIKSLTPEQICRVLDMEYPIGCEIEPFFKVSSKWEWQYSRSFSCNTMFSGGKGSPYETAYEMPEKALDELLYIHFSRYLAKRFEMLTKGWKRAWYMTDGKYITVDIGEVLGFNGTCAKIFDPNQPSSPWPFNEKEHLYNLQHGEPTGQESVPTTSPIIEAIAQQEGFVDSAFDAAINKEMDRWEESDSDRTEEWAINFPEGMVERIVNLEEELSVKEARIAELEAQINMAEAEMSYVTEHGHATFADPDTSDWEALCRKKDKRIRTLEKVSLENKVEANGWHTMYDQPVAYSAALVEKLDNLTASLNITPEVSAERVADYMRVQADNMILQAQLDAADTTIEKLTAEVEELEKKLDTLISSSSITADVSTERLADYLRVKEALDTAGKRIEELQNEVRSAREERWAVEKNAGR